MTVLSIGSDPSLFNAASPLRARLRTYADAVGALHVLGAGGHDAQEGNLFIHSIHGPKIVRPFLLARRACALIERYRVDLVTAQDPFEHGLAARRAARRTRIKLHIQVHTDFLSPCFKKLSIKNRIRVLIADRVIRAADGIRAVSERVARSLVARYPGIKEPSVIPIAASALFPGPAPLPPSSWSFTLVTVGRLEKEKRIEDVLSALVRVRARYPHTGLCIIGDGRERYRLEEEVRMLGLMENVMFLGWRSDSAALMQSAQAFIQASAYEGYGMALMEAARAGLPSITTNVGIVGEVLMPERDVLASEPTDVHALAKNILRIIEDNVLRRRLAENAQSAARAHIEANQDQAARIAADFVRVFTP